MNYREQYNTKIQSGMNFGLLGHIPVAAGIAAYFGTGIFFATMIASLIAAGPLFGARIWKGSNRISELQAFSFMSMSGLVIHLSRGMIEFHFHVFVMLACMTLYASWRAVVAAAGTIAVHHLAFFFFLPKSVFNYDASLGIVLLHAVFVVIESAACIAIARRFESILIDQATLLDDLRGSVSAIGQSVHSLHDTHNDLQDEIGRQATTASDSGKELLEVTRIARDASLKAETAEQTAEKSRGIVETGARDLESLIHSIREISNSSKDTTTGLGKTLDGFQKMAKMIHDIEEKTRMIDSIVFQTKLLSFNASVEAARAGEHGKGFTIVAQEVGSLASVTGVAAKEIREIVEASRSASESLMGDLKSRFDELSTDGLKRVTDGLTQAESCRTTLTGVLQAFEETRKAAIDIASSAREQTGRVLKIEASVKSLDSASQSSLQSTRTSAAATENIRAEMNHLDSLLEKIVSEKKVA